MITQKILASVLDFVRRLECAMDYDPIEAQARRLSILERKFDEVSGRFRDGVAVPKPSIDGVKVSIAAQ